MGRLIEKITIRQNDDPAKTDLIAEVWFNSSLPLWPPWPGWWPHKRQTFHDPQSSLWLQISCQCSSCHWPPALACQDTAAGVCAEPAQSPEEHTKAVTTTEIQRLSVYIKGRKDYLYFNLTEHDIKHSSTLEIMFMPMASPVRDWKRMYKFFPAKLTNSLSRRANLPKKKKIVLICNILQMWPRKIRGSNFCFLSVCFFWPAGLVKGLFDNPESFRGLQPDFDLCCPASRGQPHHRTPGHTVSQNPAAAAPTELYRKDKRVSRRTHSQWQHE